MKSKNCVRRLCWMVQSVNAWRSEKAQQYFLEQFSNGFLMLNNMVPMDVGIFVLNDTICVNKKTRDQHNVLVTLKSTVNTIVAHDLFESVKYFSQIFIDQSIIKTRILPKYEISTAKN